MQDYNFHTLTDSHGKPCKFSTESIAYYFASKKRKVTPFDFNVFDSTGTSLFNYSIQENKMGIFKKILSMTEETEGLFPFIKYTCTEYPIHLIFRLGDYDKFMMLRAACPKSISTQLRNLKDNNGDSPIEVLSTLPKECDDIEKIKIGKMKIASLILSNYQNCVPQNYRDSFGNVTSFTQHVREDNNFPELANLIDAYQTTHTAGKTK